MLPLTQVVTVILDGLDRELGTTLPAVSLGFCIGNVGTINAVFTVAIKFGASLAKFIW